MNNILKVYHQNAAEQNIAIEIRAAAKPGLSADIPDLVAIVANVLENALHGAAKSSSEAPFIRVNIKHQAGRFVVSCDNACVKSLVGSASIRPLICSAIAVRYQADARHRTAIFLHAPMPR